MPIIANTMSTAAPAMSPPRLMPSCFLRMFVSPWLPITGMPPLAERTEAAQLAQVEPDEEGLADDILVRHESPDPAVARIVPVVAHHEIMARRHATDQAAVIVVAVAGMLEFHAAADVAGRFLLQNDFVFPAVEALEVARKVLQPFPGLVVADLPARRDAALHREDLVAVFDPVARQADHPFDVIEPGIGRKAEPHHVAARGAADVGDLDVDPRQADAVGVLVDQDEIADQQRPDLQRPDLLHSAPGLLL